MCIYVHIIHTLYTHYTHIIHVQYYLDIGVLKVRHILKHVVQDNQYALIGDYRRMCVCARVCVYYIPVDGILITIYIYIYIYIYI